MTTRYFVAIVALLTVFMLCSSAYDADAARIGGGRSFGGSPSYSRPFSSSRLPESSVRAPSSTQQPGATTAAPSRPGFGWGGMLGGLLAGSLIASLLGGHGFAGGGMLDIVILGVGLYMLFKFLGWRRQAQTSAPGGASMPPNDHQTQYQRAEPQNGSGGMWDVLRGRNTGDAAPSQGNSTADVPAGFEQEDFLRGAKVLYQRMNDSWDRRDLSDIEEFATHPFMTEIRQQALDSPNPERTDILLVNARLVSVVKEAGRETASVYFSVTLREDASQTSPIQVREIWHFVRAADSKDMWKLDGIQQVED